MLRAAHRCEELVYICDSDGGINHTEEKVIPGLREAARVEGQDVPALQVNYVPPVGERRISTISCG